jgi:stage III sporulation protein AB
VKAAGALVVIVASYIAGRFKRADMLLGERITAQLIRFLGELKNAVQYRAGSLVAAVGECAAKESCDQLGFLADAAFGPDVDSGLGWALTSAFSRWNRLPLLTREEREALNGLFSELGSGFSSSEISRIELAAERLKASLEARRAANDKKRGYYETLFTLAGIALAIVLI